LLQFIWNILVQARAQAVGNAQQQGQQQPQTVIAVPTQLVNNLYNAFGSFVASTYNRGAAPPQATSSAAPAASPYQVPLPPSQPDLSSKRQ